MEKRILLKSQLNAIFTYINNNRLNVKDFIWIEEESLYVPNLLVPKLINQPTNYYFKFDKIGNSLLSVYFPNNAGLIEIKTWPVWDPQFNDFIMWIDIVSNELSIPNLWESFLSASRIFEGKSDIDNELFNLEEQKYISKKLAEIEKYLIEKENLSSENISFLKNKISYLEERSKHLGKKDWLNIVIGISLKIALDMALSSDAAREFLKLVGTAFSHFWGGPILLP